LERKSKYKVTEKKRRNTFEANKQYMVKRKKKKL